MPFYTFFSELCIKFDKAFIILLVIQKVNQDVWQKVTMGSQDYFKQHLQLNPVQITDLMAILSVPWSIKILYGIISDTVPICGSKRRSYVIIMGMVQCLSLFYIYMMKIQHNQTVTVLLSISSMCLAFTNVMVDAIICIQARKDPTHGTQNLFILAWMSQCAGKVLGTIISTVLTKYSYPQYNLLILSMMGMLIVLNGFFLPKDDNQQNEHYEL